MSAPTITIELTASAILGLLNHTTVDDNGRTTCLICGKPHILSPTAFVVQSDCLPTCAAEILRVAGRKLVTDGTAVLLG